MQDEIIEFVIEYLKKNASKKNPITNQQLDSQIQIAFNLKKPLGDGHIRAIVHDIRRFSDITNKKGEKGWVCGNVNGYFVSYNAYDILEHLNNFEGKIRKMTFVHQEGMKLLVNKMYYKQGKLNF
jgi:hypothetical protein